MSRGYKLDSSLEIFPGGAALVSSTSTMVVADLHLGCEAVLEQEGVSIPRLQIRTIERYLVDIIRSVGPSKLVVAGDLKHNFSRNLTQEWQEVSRFVRGITRLVPIEVVKGNHDNFLAPMLREFDVPFAMEAEAGGFRICHGHRGPRSPEPTIMGHIHPSIGLKDGVGARIKDRCYLYDEKAKMLILPALSLVAGGLDVVEQPDADEASPLLPSGGLANFHPIAFAGDRPLRFPSVGTLRDMRSSGQV